MTDFVLCPECGNEQADMGRGVQCEECGYGPMPTNAPTGKIDEALAKTVDYYDTLKRLLPRKLPRSNKSKKARTK